MARINLNCTCGWTFFIPGTTTGHEVSCPSCGQSVRIPGRKPGQDVPMSAGEVAAEHQRRQGKLRLIIGGVAALLVAGAIYALIPGSTQEPEVQVEVPNPVPRPRPPKPPDPPKVDHRTTQTPTRPLSDEQIADFKRTIQERIWMINLSTVVAEIIRYRGQPEGTRELQRTIAEHEAKIKSCVAELAKVDETVPLESCFAGGDRILCFGESDFRTMYAGTAAQVLHNWAIAWSPGGSVHQAVVLRGGRELSVHFMFPEESKDLPPILRHPALQAEVLSGGGASDRAAIPADLVQRYQSGMEALPAGYTQFVAPPVLSRMKEVLGRKMASGEEVEWFKAQLDEVLPALESDFKAIRQKLGDLEVAVKDNPAPDAVILKDGQRLDGKVQPLGEDKVRVQLRQGARNLMKEEIARIDMGKGIGTEVAKQLEAAKGNVDKLESAMLLSGNRNLTNEKLYAACQILLLNPAHEKARQALGLPRPLAPRSK